MSERGDGPSTKDLSGERLIDLLRQMMLIRRFEEKAAEMYARRRIAGFLHLYIGQEAVAVGAIAAINDDDHIVTHYREHGHALARGVEPGRVMAELFGKSTGVSAGKGGSMHLFDTSRFFMGGYAIVAGHLPLACGLALANQRQSNGRIVLCVFGDGAVNEGEFHESLNLAAVWKLPIIFLCENNCFGMGTDIRRVSAITDVYQRACAYDLPSQQVDGMNVLEVYRATKEAASHARSGEGPAFVEAVTYRFRGHSMADPELYRTKDETQRWRDMDPIVGFRRRLEQEDLADKAALDELQAEAEKVVDEATRFAEESPHPPPAALYEHVYKRQDS